MEETGCKYCANTTDITAAFQLYAGDIKVWIETIPGEGALIFYNCWRNGELDTVPIKYCPMCGRKL